MQRILEGDLSRFAVPDVLTFLDMARLTGALVMERLEQESKLFFKEGKPIFATTTKEGLRIGHMLVRSGKLKEATVERLLAEQRAGGRRLGQALLAESLMTEAELASILKVQVSEVIFETFEWPEGTFTFWDKVPPPATAVTLDMDLQNLLMEGVRRIDERGHIKEVFPDLDFVVEVVTNPERVKQSVTLTPEEWKVFFLVDGRRTLSEICRLAGNPDDLTTLQVLHNLTRANFVAVGAPRPEEHATVDLRGGAPPPVPPQSTMRVADGKAPPPPAAEPVAVAFSSGLPARRAEDDTRDVVTPDAVHYMQSAKKISAGRLVLVTEGGSESSFPLTRDSYTLGRHRNNDITVNDPKVSSFHARIDRTPDGFLLVDLKSRNGSYVNGKKIETVALKTGDEVRMGMARLHFKVDYTS